MSNMKNHLADFEALKVENERLREYRDTLKRERNARQGSLEEAQCALSNSKLEVQRLRDGVTQRAASMNRAAADYASTNLGACAALDGHASGLRDLLAALSAPDPKQLTAFEWIAERVGRELAKRLLPLEVDIMGKDVLVTVNFEVQATQPHTFFGVQADGAPIHEEAFVMPLATAPRSKGT